MHQLLDLRIRFGSLDVVTEVALPNRRRVSDAACSGGRCDPLALLPEALLLGLLVDLRRGFLAGRCAALQRPRANAELRGQARDMRCEAPRVTAEHQGGKGATCCVSDDARRPPVNNVLSCLFTSLADMGVQNKSAPTHDAIVRLM